MNDRENFLSRWSRRKREAEESAPEAAVPTPVESAAASETTARENSPEKKESAAPDVDLSTLPPIESITSSTDISGFLKAGIPAPLTRAALRRAWVADPAIRDFVGLSENAWDFNAPDSVPGFGSVLPSEQAQRMVASMFGDSEPATPSLASTAAPERSEASASSEAPQVSQNEPAAPVPASDALAADQNDSNVAPQEENLADDSAKKIAQRHGGALPR